MPLELGSQTTYILEQAQICNQQIHLLIACFPLDFGLRRLAFLTIVTNKHHRRTTARQFSGRDFAHARSTPRNQANLSLHTKLIGHC